MKKYLILAMMLVPGTGKAATPNHAKSKATIQGYATISGDTLRIGNNKIERMFLWNKGNLKTIGLLNKQNGRTISAQGKTPDMSLVKGEPTDARMETETVAENGLHRTYLNVNITYAMGDLKVWRQFKVYDDVPAIACDTYLKGSLSLQKQTNDVNGADRKNIENTADMDVVVKMPVLDQLELNGKHWQTRTVEFYDYTDWNDNLVFEQSFIPYRENSYRGNLLISTDQIHGDGFFLLKEAPCSSTQLNYPGYDFKASFSTFKVTGFGISDKDVKTDEWTRAYGVVTGVHDGTELDALMALRTYQKQSRIGKRANDEMIMMNTWGDRSQDAKINNDFCLAELDRAKRLGVTVFQLDDGWEEGKSPNSKTAGGSFKDIWQQKDYWKPNKKKFPNGLTDVVKKGKKLGIRIGLWFNPSIQDEFADWEKDAEAMLGLWREYGITIFKIDGLQIPSKLAEQRLRNLFDRVLEKSNGEVMFNLDATAGRRGGYNMFTEYGNTFLENRYTDWGNYYPYHTLRNLWQLSKYVPAERLQVEFLNKWRNPGKYPKDDVFAPANYTLEYLFALTMAGQPLAWMEAQNLPEEAYAAANVIKPYHKIQEEMHAGCILPIGNEPSGRSWTGFQSICSAKSGYLLIIREDNDQPTDLVKTWLKEGDQLSLEPVCGSGPAHDVEVGKNGQIEFSVEKKNDFQLYRYKIK